MGRSAIVALLLCAHVAAAQEAPHLEPYWLAGRLDGITAKLVVRYHLAVVGPSGSNHFELDVPDNGVVTGAVVSVEGVAHRLAFEAVDQGNAEFQEVLAKPAGPRRRWAITVSSEYSSATKVDVAAPHAARMTIDLEVEAPTCFSHGMRYASVDPAWRASLDHTLRISTAIPAGCIARPTDDGGTGMAKTWIAFASDDGRWRPAGEERVVARGERVDVDHGHFARVEVNLASELSELPADLHTVFVIDTSRSMTATERETQAAVVQSYARHAPGTQIQIVAFARKAHALLPDWTRAGDARLAGLATLPEANGSNVDTALIEAASWLARTTGTRRLVLFGDERLGKRVAALQANVLRGLVPANTLVHVVALDAAPPPKDAGPPHEATLADSIVRADAIAFAGLAHDTEGLAARAMLVDDRVDATKLVRPIALEQLAVHATGWADIRVEANEPACIGDLAEGGACAWFGADDPGKRNAELAPTVVLEGLLWNHRVRRTITPDAGQRERLARILTGFMANLGDAEHDLQVVAHAVNEAWVLYGEWGHDDGYADDSYANVYASGCGCDNSGMLGGFGFGSPPRVRMFGGLTIAQQLERATAACHVVERVEISIELTEREIVDVAVTAPSAGLRDCVTEAVWATNLSVNDPQPHAFETIALGA